MSADTATDPLKTAKLKPVKVKAAEPLPIDLRETFELMTKAQRDVDTFPAVKRASNSPMFRSLQLKLDRVKAHWKQIQQGLPTISTIDADTVALNQSTWPDRLKNRVQIGE